MKTMTLTEIIRIVTGKPVRTVPITELPKREQIIWINGVMEVGTYR